MLARLGRECEAPGGQAAWAKAHGVSAAYVNDVLRERREPGKAILDALGLEKVMTYREKRPKIMRHKASRPAKGGSPKSGPDNEA